METIRIYGTFGPSCHSFEDLCALLDLGVDGMRLNLSHMKLQDAANWIGEWKKALAFKNRQGELLIDLQGRELRIGQMEPLLLEEGKHVILKKDIPISDEIYHSCSMGDILLLDDGKVKLQVLKKEEDGALCAILQGGLITSRKGLKIEGKELDLPPLRQEDYENLMHAKEMGVSGLMVPFIKNASDLQKISQALKLMGLDLKLLAKIENQDGVDHLEEFFEHCDEIVIARGDLGNSVSLPKLPWIQHDLEERCKKASKPYMIVTQLLESMRTSPSCTRAEANDVFWSAYNGASSMMLTGETADGLYPIQAMETLCSIAHEALGQKEKTKTSAGM